MGPCVDDYNLMTIQTRDIGIVCVYCLIVRAASQTILDEWNDQQNDDHYNYYREDFSS